MSRQRVVEYHIARLNDKRASVRLDAIKQLELLGAIEALNALQAVFNDDVDVDVRKAAQEAGRKIFLSKNNAQESE